MQPAPLQSRNETGLVHAFCALVAIAALGCVAAAPTWLWPLLAAVTALGVAFLALRHTIVACVVWLLITGMTLEMTLTDALGPAAFQTTIAAVKATEVGLAALCALRWGLRWDAFNPAGAFFAMAAAGMAHGLYPGLTASDSLRSLAGSVAPFAFFFCRLPAAWPPAMIRATAWSALLAVALGAVATAAGLRPFFVDSGGWRLTGLGHPAFLAGVALAGTYASLTELYRGARGRDLGLLVSNLLIIVLTGARAPLFYALAVIGVSVAVVPSPQFPPRYRLLLVLSAAAALPIVLVAAAELPSVRLFNLLDTDIGNLSGREYLWPAFEAAADGSPWVGWGVGAGNAIIPPQSAVAQLLHTWAAHNEYLRIQVEGGHLGRALLVGSFMLWVSRNTARLPASDRWITRLVFVALAGHAVTDNVLISTPACVLFAFIAAVFARGRQEQVDAAQHSRLPDSRRKA